MYRLVNATPTVSYDVTDWLTIGAGLQIQYFDVRYTAANLGALGVSSLAGDDIGFGFTLGVPFARGKWGLALGLTPFSEVGYNARTAGQVGSDAVMRPNSNATILAEEPVTMQLRRRLDLTQSGSPVLIGRNPEQEHRRPRNVEHRHQHRGRDQPLHRFEVRQPGLGVGIGRHRRPADHGVEHAAVQPRRENGTSLSRARGMYSRKTPIWS